MIDTRKPRPKSAPKHKGFHGLDIDVLRLLRRYWMLMLGFVILGWGLAATYSFLVAPTYSSSAEIMLLPRDQDKVTRGVDGGQTESTLSEAMMATFIDSISKSRIVKTALDNSGLTQTPSLIKEMRANDDHVSSYVIKNLDVTRGGDGQARDSHIINIAFKHKNAEDAKLVVDAIVNEFVNFVNTEFQDENVEAAKLITEASQQQEKDLAATRSAFEEFQKTTPILFSPDQSTNIYRLQYEQIQTALTELRLQRSEVMARLDMVKTQLEEIAATVTEDNGESSTRDLERLALVDEKSAARVGIFLDIFYSDAQSAVFQEDQGDRIATARTKHETLLKLKSQRTSLEAEFGPNYPELSSINKQIAEIEQFVEEEQASVAFDSDAIITPSKIVDGYVRLLRNDLAEYDKRESQLTAESAIAESKAKELIQYELDGESLRMALDSQQALYDATIDRLRDINMTKDFAGFIIEIMEAAKVGEVVWPSLPICLVLGTMFGCGLGGLAAAASEIRNRSLRSSSDIESVSGVPILSFVPTFENFRSRRLARTIRERGLTVDNVIYTAHSPQSQESEVFRGLRTSLFFRAKELNARVIAVTSSNSGDGKSTVTANLAASMAQTGRKILLIESDMRRPSVAKLLGVQSDRGMSELLQGTADVKDVYEQSCVPNLTVLASGGVVSNPAELLSSPNLQAFLDKASDEFDFVLIDCPPVLAVSDPCIVSGVSDAVIVVIRINQHSRVELQKTMSMLGDVNANVVGIVVNASQLESEVGGGKNAYMNSYGYGPRGSNAQRYYVQSANGSHRANGRVSSNGSAKTEHLDDNLSDVDD